MRWPQAAARAEADLAIGHPTHHRTAPVAPAGAAPEPVPARWWVAHTKSRFEKAFAFDLLARRVPYFLPMVQRVRVSGGRKRHGLMPLFPGYVFFRGGGHERHAALATGRLCQVIDVVDQSRLLRELEALDQALSQGAGLDPYPFAAVGRRCRVTAGAFQGLEGVVVRRDGRARLVLEVAMLGQAAAMEIDADLLEPAGPDLPRLPDGPLARSA